MPAMLNADISSSSDDDAILVPSPFPSIRATGRGLPAYRQLQRSSRASLSTKTSHTDLKAGAHMKETKETNIHALAPASSGFLSLAAAADVTVESEPEPTPAPLISLIQFDALVAAKLTKIHLAAIGLMHPLRHFRAAVYAYLVKEMYGDDPAGFAINDMRVDLALVGLTPGFWVGVQGAPGVGGCG